MQTSLNKFLYETPEYRDWRLPENRKELFKRYFKWRVWSKDLDHTHYKNHFCENYDYERRAWFAMTFGMTYRTPQCFAYTETFPYFQEIDFGKLEAWNLENWKRTSYGTDARYNKGHFFDQCVSLKEWLGSKTFQQKLESICVFSSEKKNFEALYSEILKIHKFGRMTGWLSMQALFDLLKLPIDPGEIMISGYSPMNDSSLQSIWNGLCAYENLPEKMVGKYGSYEITNKDVDWASEKLMEYTASAEEFAGEKVDSFKKESIWCQYKRLFNEKESREYPGHASGDAASRYLFYKANWPEIDWKKFRVALRSQPGIVAGSTYRNEYNKIFGRTGFLLNMHEMFPDIPDAYDNLGININEDKVKEIWLDDSLEVPVF